MFAVLVPRQVLCFDDFDNEDPDGFRHLQVDWGDFVSQKDGHSGSNKKVGNKTLFASTDGATQITTLT